MDSDGDSKSELFILRCYLARDHVSAFGLCLRWRGNLAAGAALLLLLLMLNVFFLAESPEHADFLLQRKIHSTSFRNEVSAERQRYSGDSETAREIASFWLICILSLERPCCGNL